jgi:tetratricopeptide (TPR) repeat protein
MKPSMPTNGAISPNGLVAAERALAIARKAFGARDPRTLTSVNNLAALYQIQGRYGEAEPLLEQALQLSREVLGPRRPDTISTLSNKRTLSNSCRRVGP